MSIVVATKFNDLLEKLAEKQNREGLSDHKFAKKINISYQLWQMTRTGNRDIGLAVLKGVGEAYPELAPDVLIFLGFDVDVSAKARDTATARSETHQDKQQGGLKKLLRALYLWFRGSNGE